MYASALVFSPACSLIREMFKHDEPDWIVKPAMEDEWNACLWTLDVRRQLLTMSFDTTGSYLYTDIGTVSVSPVLDSALSTADPQGLRIHLYGISSDGR